MNTATEDKSPFDGQTYREHLILYMDILGYSALMLSDDEKKKQRAIIDLQTIGLHSDKSGYLESDREGTSIQPLTAYLSDTYICSFPVEELKKTEFGLLAAFSVISNEIIHIHNLFLKHGMLVRGSVVYGKMMNHNGVAFGEGLAKAHKLESGKPPFVYFDKNVIADAIKTERNAYAVGLLLNEYLFNYDGSDIPCYDWLKDIRYISPEDYSQLSKRINEHVLQINKNLLATQNNPRAHEKWLAVAKYYDTKIKEDNDSLQYLPDLRYTGEQIHFP